jgi:23S rRNA G2069 N7-methylase RlmK/C1962 C5-methylase RlmI
MTDTFDVDRDHPRLLQDCVDRLTPGGEVLFSTNSQGFKMQVEAEELTALPPDFRNRKQHRLWRVTRG